MFYDDEGDDDDDDDNNNQHQKHQEQTIFKERVDCNLYTSYVANFLSNAQVDSLTFEQKSTLDRVKEENTFLFAIQNVTRRHKMEYLPQHKFYVKLMDIIRRDRTGSEQPLDDSNCVREAVKILRNLFEERPNVIWNSRKNEIITNINAWTPLDSKKRKELDSTDVAQTTPRSRTMSRIYNNIDNNNTTNNNSSIGATASMGYQYSGGGNNLFVSTHHQNVGPEAEWKSFESLLVESLNAPETIMNNKRSSRQSTRKNVEKNRGEGEDNEKKKNEVRIPCSYDQCLGPTLLFGHVAYILEYDLNVRRAFALSEQQNDKQKKNSLTRHEKIIDVLKASLLYRLFFPENKVDVDECINNLNKAIMRGCCKDDADLEKLMASESFSSKKDEKRTIDEDARFKRLDASTKELARSAAIILNALLSIIWDLKELGKESSSISSVGLNRSNKSSLIDKVEDTIFQMMKKTVITEANKKAHGGDKFTINYLRSIGPERVHLELFRRIFVNDINKEYAPKLFSEENFPAFGKRERNELSEDIALLFSGSTKDIRHIGIAKKSLRNELSNLGHLFSILVKNRDYDHVESESGGDDDDTFKHAQVSLEFELKKKKVQSEDDERAVFMAGLVNKLLKKQ
jgi:hypothetical protein